MLQRRFRVSRLRSSDLEERTGRRGGARGRGLSLAHPLVLLFVHVARKVLTGVPGVLVIHWPLRGHIVVFVCNGQRIDVRPKGAQQARGVLVLAQT